MVESIVSWFWLGVAAYAAAGVIFAIPFLLFGAGRMDPLAKTGSWGFRIFVLPAAIALWPILARKFFHLRPQSDSPTDPERPVRPAILRLIHGVTFVGIAVFIPIVCAAALWSRSVVVTSSVNFNPEPEAAGPTPRIDAASLPIRITTQANGDRRTAVLDVSKPLVSPVVAVYWSPVAAPAGIGPDAVFLGSVWGPTRLAFPLPPASAAGVLTFIALTNDQRVLETVNLR